MSRAEPTILERLQVGGLKPELVALFRDVHRRRHPCGCSLCQRQGKSAPTSEKAK